MTTPAESHADRAALERREQVTGWAFVGAQAAFIGALILVPAADHYPVPGWLRTATNIAFWLGVVLAIAAGIALGRSLTATPVPKEHATLRTTGPYRWVRHPIYTGVILIVVAMAVRSGSWFGIGLGIATMVFFNAKASWEEQRLTKRFDGYAAYAAATPRFIPFV